jgi:hypothetical protein
MSWIKPDARQKRPQLWGASIRRMSDALAWRVASRFSCALASRDVEGATKGSEAMALCGQRAATTGSP